MSCLKNKKWWEAAGTRAIKTAAQAALSLLTVGQFFFDIDWGGVLSVSAVAAIVSLITSLAGLPEVDDGDS